MRLKEERRGDLAYWILTGEGSIRTLTEAVFDGLDAAVKNLAGCRGVILTSDCPGHFCAGADLETIASVERASDGEALARRGQSILQAIEDAPVPVVAALPGTCLGGGLELALACHARVAAETARLGLPEVRVGLLPGLGGTQRLPRLLGLKAALPLLLTGKTVDAKKARRLGLIDAIASAAHVQRAAERMLDRLPIKRARRRGLLDLIPALPKRIAAGKIPSGYEAPRRVLRAIGRGYEVEANELGAAIASKECKQLVRLFHAATACKRGADAAKPRFVGVLGFGTMGAGIAGALTRAGIAVRVRDRDDDAIVRGLRHFRGDKDRLTVTTGWEGFAAAEIVIEAVPEDLALKREVLGRAAQAAPRALLMSNTSSLSVEDLGVVGLHFFNPVRKMPLVEVVAAPSTPEEAVRRARSLAVTLRKTPVVVTDAPGFLVNRILGRYLSAAAKIDASEDAIDAAARAFGFPMGPFEVLDVVGHGVARAVSAQLHGAYGERFGQKPRFREAKRRRADPADLSPALDALRDEARRCLDEGIAHDPGQVDLACAMGFGYPAWRGPILEPLAMEMAV